MGLYSWSAGGEQEERSLERAAEAREGRTQVGIKPVSK